MNSAIFTHEHMSSAAVELITDLVNFNCPIDGAWIEPEYKWLSDFYCEATNSHTTQMEITVDMAKFVLPHFNRIKSENEQELGDNIYLSERELHNADWWIFKCVKFNRMIDDLTEFANHAILPKKINTED